MELDMYLEDLITKIQKFLDQNIPFNNLSRKIKADDSKLYDDIKKYTSWLGNTQKFTERLYVIMNNISNPVMNEFGKPAVFVNYHEGYSLRSATFDANQKFLEKTKKLKDRSANFKQSKESRDAHFVELSKMIGKLDAKIGLKIHKFIQRNDNYVNSHLYNEAMVEGYDYVECPLLNVRKSMIDTRHFTALELTKEEYLDLVYDKIGTKDINFICKKRVENITSGLSKIDEETGLSKHALAIKKAVKTKLVVDENGLTLNQKSGIKTRNTHMANVDENGMNGYQRIAKVARPKQIAHLQSIGQISNDVSIFKFYRQYVDWLTKPKKHIVQGNKPTGKMGTPGAYQIDHIYPVVQCFNNNIGPSLASHINNLQCISWQDNAERKSKDLWPKIDKIFNLTNSSQEQSKLEFNIFLDSLEYLINLHGTNITSIHLIEEINRRTIMNGTTI